MNYMIDSLKEANNNQSSNSSSINSQIMKSKGKRTKRQRVHHLPLPTDPFLSATTSSSSIESTSSTTEEEEDMAKCLILLAQGHGLNNTRVPASDEVNTIPSEKFTSRRYTETDGGLYVYECKTCNKCFPSFQALGGHRASHTKPKLAEEKNSNIFGELDGLQMNENSLAKPVFVGANHNSGSGRSKVHQCSICGAEFSSGQALGGHMRRHRPLNVSTEVKSEEFRSVLSLDLNLPAPDEDEGHLSSTVDFPVEAFERKQQLVFSLVDCHY